MESVFERHDREARMARRVRRDVYRLDLVGCGVPDHLFATRIRFGRACALLEKLALLRIKVGDRNHLDIRMVLVAELRAEIANALARDSDAHLPIGERRPCAAFELARIHVVEVALLAVLLSRLRKTSRREKCRSSAKK